MSVSGIQSERAGRVPASHRIALWTLTALSILLLALIGVRLQASGLPIAIWWPAAGVSLAFALRVARERRWVVIVLIFDLTHSRDGFININQQPMHDLRQFIASGL